MEGIILGQYLVKKRMYKSIIVVNLVLVILGILMTISGINEKATYERLKESGIIKIAICYGRDRTPLSEKKYNKRSYWEWEYNGKYYGKDVVQTDEETQLAQIGKTCNVYIDPENPSTYILEIEGYNPKGTMYIGIAIFAVFGLVAVINIFLIKRMKRKDSSVNGK